MWRTDWNTPSWTGGYTETCYDDVGRPWLFWAHDAITELEYGGDQRLDVTTQRVRLHNEWSPDVAFDPDDALGFPLQGFTLGHLDPAAPTTVRYTHDDHDLVTSVGFDLDGDGDPEPASTLTLALDPASGALDGTSILDLATTTARDGFGATLSWSATWGQPGATTPLWSRDYDHDALGRITWIEDTYAADPPRTYDYTYDAAGRLEKVTEDGVDVRQYAYDANGNRTTLTDLTTNTTLYAWTDAQDRLVAYGPDGTDPDAEQNNHYIHDDNGRLTQKEVPNPAGGPALATLYSYDARGSLEAVDLSDDDATTIAYRSDHRGRRDARLVHHAGVLAPAEARVYVYQDQLNPVAELDGAGQVEALYAYGSKPNTPDLMWKDGAVYRLLSDHLGSVRFVVNVDSGDVAQELRYDEYGRVVEDTAVGFQPFGFAGGLYDAATGLVRFGARDYDPEVGRWTAKDPIGFAGGDSLLYGYVGGEPIGASDVTGLTTYRCSKPLEFHDSMPKNAFLELLFPPLRHEFLCTMSPAGDLSCAGFYPQGAKVLNKVPGGSTGEFRDDSEHVGQWYTDCEVVSDNECIDHCVTQELGFAAEAQYGETPGYGVWLGQMDCQEWASDVLWRCQRRCLAERLLDWFGP